MLASSKKTKRYFELARRAAWQSDFETRHGAVLVSGGSVVNVSHNSSKWNAFAARFHQKSFRLASRHAEISCILGIAREKTENSILFVVRINRVGKLMMSKPCAMCATCCAFVGIDKIFYSIDENNIGILRLK